MLNPCNPCVCYGAPCEQCMFGYRSAKENHESMKKLLLAFIAGEKPTGWRCAETYQRYHENWRDELGLDVDESTTLRDDHTSFNEGGDIMKTSFTFNQKTSAYAYDDVEYNRLFVKHQETYINDLLKARGYIYLNQIYEMFGVKWNTDWENTCIEYELKKRHITLGIARENENGFDIDIL